MERNLFLIRNKDAGGGGGGELGGVKQEERCVVMVGKFQKCESDNSGAQMRLLGTAFQSGDGDVCTHMQAGGSPGERQASVFPSTLYI